MSKPSIVTSRHVEPHGMVCDQCNRAFSVGDEYRTVRMERSKIEIGVVVCVPCAGDPFRISNVGSDQT